MLEMQTATSYILPQIVEKQGAAPTPGMLQSVNQDFTAAVDKYQTGRHQPNLSQRISSTKYLTKT